MNWLEWMKHNAPSPPYNYGRLVPPIGPLGAKIALVGEAPGEDEVISGQPFVGWAGKELDKMLAEVGINRSACFITNVCCERPTDNKFQAFFYETLTKPKRRVPKSRLLKWRTCLLKQLELVKPNVVVALGNEPLAALTGLSGITKRRGSIYLTQAGLKVVPVLHPAAVLRNWRTRTIAVHDLGRAKKESSSPERTEPCLLFHVDPTYEDVIQYLEFILEEKPSVTIDLETLWKTTHIACLGIGHKPDEAMVIPFSRTIGHYWRLDREAQIIARLVKILRDPEIGKEGQNFISFDSYIFWLNWGVVPRNITFDTMHGQHILYPERFGPNMGLGLEFLTSLYTDPVINYYKDEGKTWERKIGELDFWNYCGKDVVSTKQSSLRIKENLDRVALLQNSTISSTDILSNSSNSKKQRSMLNFYEDYTLPLSKVLFQLQTQGIRIDQQRKLKLYSSNERIISWMQSVIDESVRRGTHNAISSLNVRSHQQMKSLLYEYWNLPRQYKGRGISRSLTVDENALVQLKTKYPYITEFFDFVLRQKELLKEQDFLKTPVAPDGRMRTVLSTSGTETGRLASRTPPCGYGTNFQNVKDKLRSIFVPDAGYEMWAADASQAEARVVAVIAQQWDLVDLFERGDIDVHWENAKRIFELRNDLLYNRENKEHYRMRYLAKRIIHASNYGMSWYKFRQLLLTDAGLDMSKQEVERLLEAYHRIYPNIRGIYHRGIVSQLRRYRELVNPYGRRRIFHDRWPKGDGELFRQAYAFWPQSTIADMINHVLLDFHNWSQTTLNRVKVLHQNHDEILYQVRPSYAKVASEKLKELMERPIKIGNYNLVIPADFARGMNWGKHSATNEQGLQEVRV